ncbi:hypothetical protein C435_06423 [Haloarcula marismortui ATCC 33799]|uniref:Uncharacterized protein n=1 Tax=Haloarcula marismortui ATCC 33799 TaxID=662475 RepID=M0KKF7_9EURY|nr:hypothetical protein C435_06423 [Haloarcula californiae ATCC 33799]
MKTRASTEQTLQPRNEALRAIAAAPALLVRPRRGFGTANVGLSGGRVAVSGFDSVTGSTFTLHVVRSTDSGTVYEDTVGHLSESEREVTGLVFALAGYLVHDVYEEVPFILLDSLEAIDSERIASLVEYFAEFPSYLVVALLPEDAQALSDSYNRITDI